MVKKDDIVSKNSPPWTIENESSKIASAALRGRGGSIRLILSFNFANKGL